MDERKPVGHDCEYGRDRRALQLSPGALCMAIHEKDIKLLWGRAAGRCSYPGCPVKLSQDKLTATGAFPLGEHAHIVSEETGGPRGHSPLTADERNSYFNLILLCPNHHTIVDKDIDGHPADCLHIFKAKHELWVEQTLNPSATVAASDLAYTALIDAVVDSADLDNWNNWTSWAMRQPPIWSADSVDKVTALRQQVFRAIWPGTLPELERAITTFASALYIAANVALKHADLEGPNYQGTRFYKIREWDQERYDRLFAEYEEWIDDCGSSMIDACCGANWFADVVRRDVNPAFYIAAGRFTLTLGPTDATFRNTTRMPTFSEPEKEVLPDRLLTVEGNMGLRLP
jgi:hypothetical protein